MAANEWPLKAVFAGAAAVKLGLRVTAEMNKSINEPKLALNC